MENSKKYRVPSCSGKKGLPPGMNGKRNVPKGISSPTTTGTRGKPHSHKFPGTPAAKD